MRKGVIRMPWGESLKEINSASIDDLHEYFSRPADKVLDLVRQRKDKPIVIYGATGKWMSDLTEMLLRAIRETGASGRNFHIVSRFSRKSDFDKRFSKYQDLFIAHVADFVNPQKSSMKAIPDDAAWVIYGLGYKFRTHESEEEYAHLCSLYGNYIPHKILNYHKQADVVVIGSANGVDLTPIDNQAKDDAPLVPKDGNLYGISIRDKEVVVRQAIEGSSSKAVILRGAYMTDLTYGGIETPALAVRDEKVIDLEKLTYFNIISHRDANIYAILAVGSASNPVTTLNLSGHTADIREIAKAAADAFSKTARYKNKPSQLHLLIDGSKILQLYGPPIDSLSDLINAQIFWIMNGGYSRSLNHHVGESM